MFSFLSGGENLCNNLDLIGKGTSKHIEKVYRLSSLILEFIEHRKLDVYKRVITTLF